MKYIIPILISFSILFTNVYAVTDGTDEVTINSPSEDANVSGSVQIEWIMKDTEIDDPAYFVDLYNLGCAQNGGNLGRITSSGATKEGTTYKYSWDTNAGSASGNLKDGSNYCVRVCGILAKGAGVYSLCDKVSFVYSRESTSGNSDPIITDTGSIFNIKPEEEFSYQVTAQDEDGDTLTYSLSFESDLFSIDSKTGEITGQSSEIGEYKLTVSVQDGKGGVDTKDYLIKVGIEEASNLINFTNPVAGTTLTPENNQIRWTINDQIDIESIIISYSTDSINWTEIATVENNETSYDWNLAELEPGRYYIKVEATDFEGEKYTSISEEFQISKEGSSESNSQITDPEPAPGAKISELSGISISAKFNFPQGVTLDEDTIQFTLNEREDLTVCEVSQEGITCEVVGELAEGNYKVFLSLQDSTGSTQTKEWSFDVGTSDEQTSNTPLAGNTIRTIIIIFLIGLVLILIPWVLYVLIKKRRRQSKITTKSPETGVPQGIVEPGVVMNTNPAPQITQTQVVAQVVPELERQLEQQVSSTAIPVPQVMPSTADANIPVVNLPENLVSISSNQQNSIAESPINYVEPEVMNTIPNLTASPIENNEVINTLPPSMYSNDQIPQWMESTNKDEVIQNNSSTAEEIISKTDIAQGSRVYDPYGLALNPDEVSEQQNN